VVKKYLHVLFSPFRISSQSGNATLFTAAIIPVALSLTVLAVDVSGYQSLRERAQQEADRIALEAVRALPDQAAARLIVERAAGSLDNLRLAEEESDTDGGSISSTSVSVVLEGKREALFDLFLPRQHWFAVREQAEATVVPLDLVLVLADGFTLRPPAQRAWGDAERWPASNYFNFVSNPLPQGLPELGMFEPGVYWPSWWNEWETSTFRRWVTQSCFNPHYSALKLAAISIIDYVSAVASNRLAVLFTPGEDSRIGFHTVHPLETTGATEVKVNWSDRMELATYFSDEACLLLAHPESSAADRFAIPPSDARFVRDSKAAAGCESPFRSTGWGELWFPYGHLASCFTDQSLSVREAVYYHASRSTPLTSDGAHILAAIDQALIQLTSSDDATYQRLSQARGSLVVTPRRTIVVISDVLPGANSGALIETLERVVQAKARLTIVSYAHAGLSPARADELRQANELLGNLAHPALEVLRVTSGEELLLSVVPRILNQGQEYVLRR
jgi:hypothetical protein